MKLRRRFSDSLRTLVTHKVRTLLALSAVAFGVAAVVLARSVGEGARLEVERIAESTGKNLLLIKPVQVKRPVFRPEMSGLATTLKEDDREAIASLSRIAAAIPTIEEKSRIKHGRLAMRCTLRGTSERYADLRNIALAEGRFFDAEMDDRSARVAVIGARVQRELGQGKSLVGKTLSLGGVPFEVIGVSTERGTSADGANEDDHIVIPIRTALRRFFNKENFTAIYAQVKQADDLQNAAAEIAALLRERHRLRGRADDFAVQEVAMARTFSQELTENLSLYATWLAAIALLLGGIGIMALLFLSVRERRPEIGLRMAVGALPSDILLQFLIEAAFLAIAGWFAGNLIAGLCIAGLTAATAFPMAWPIPAMLLSLIMTVGIGISFGVLPAQAASKIPPVEALQKP